MGTSGAGSPSAARCDHDLYAERPTTDTPYAAGDHIPGLNVGGWYDARDSDIRTRTHSATVLGLVEVWERFRFDRDETTVDQTRRFVGIHAPGQEARPALAKRAAAARAKAGVSASAILTRGATMTIMVI
jgi:hypothetical protein